MFLDSRESFETYKDVIHNGIGIFTLEFDQWHWCFGGEGCIFCCLWCPLKRFGVLGGEGCIFSCLWCSLKRFNLTNFLMCLCITRLLRKNTKIFL